MTSSSESDIELLPCSFQFRNFLSEVGEVKISCQMIKMEDSYYIWIGNFGDNIMNDLSLAMTSAYEKVPISTQLLGSIADSTSLNLAKRLTKKLGTPVYVSFNIQADNLSMPAIEKKIQQEISTSLATFTEQMKPES